MGCLRRDLDGIEKAIDLVVGGKREHDDEDAREGAAACNCMMKNGSICCEFDAWMYLQSGIQIYKVKQIEMARYLVTG